MSSRFVEKMIRIVVSVVIVGLMFLWMFVNIWCGSVVWFVFVRNSVMIILLNDVVNVNSVFDIMFGVIIGSVMWKKVDIGFVLSDRFVCMRFWLKFCSVVVIVVMMNGMLSVVCVVISFV